jgi:hypothetical protein
MLVGVVAFLSFTGCAGEEPPPPPPVVVPEPPPPPPPPAEPQVMTIDALAAGHADNAGKPVKVKGFYGSMTKQDNPAQINVDMNEKDTLDGAKAVCVFAVDKEPALAELTQKDEIFVTGTLAADKMGDAEKIDGCELTEGGMRQKAKAKAGGDGGGDGGGKAGKGGKAKGG